MSMREDFVGLEEPAQLADLLSELSGRCTTADTNGLDTAIDECQQLVCERLAVDHSELWQAYEEPEDSLLLTHLYQRTDSASKQPRKKPCGLASQHEDVARQDLPLRTDAKAFFPWIFQRTLASESVAIATLEDLPAEAMRDREMLARDGIKSLAVVPLATGEDWFGLLAFEMNTANRSWTELELQAFRLTGEVFSNALARLRTHCTLRDADLKLGLATTNTGTELWTLHTPGGRMSVSATGRRLLDLAEGEVCHYARFLRCVAREDQESVERGLEMACSTGQDVPLEYRIVGPGGDVHWIRSRWHPVGSSSDGTSRIIAVCVEITEEKKREAELGKANAELRALKQRVKAANDCVESEIKVNHRHSAVVGESRGIRKVLQQVEQVAPVNCPVLITGESGTGKELIAQSIHRLSPRGSRMMVTVNCAALPSGLVESELFGRERGAFTGAMNSQAGRFELADQSTIFLDEITELSLELQGKLLRVLQEGEYARLGNPKTRKVDVRVIAATNRDLSEEVRKQKFREDLFYRLSVFPINLPPLRERPQDIPLLVFAFLQELSSRMGKKVTKVPRRVMEALERHYWPGNIRELRNVIERGVILSTGDTLRIAFSEAPQAAQPAVTLAEVERQHILATLDKTDWHIKGPHGAAKILDLKPGTLYSRMRKLGVPHRRQKEASSD